MTVRDVQNIIEGWAPKEIAWEKDNTGLQVGSLDDTVKIIYVCLDATEDTVREAAARRANLIISHHPLLFRPARSINLHTSTGKCIARLLRSKISLYAVHTNLDFSQDGTSFALAKKIGLKNVDFLLKSYKLTKKIVTFVPRDHIDRVAQAMGSAGAGKIGNYEMCSFKSHGTGSFRGSERSAPTVGTKGRLVSTEEIRLEMVVDQPNLQEVVKAMIKAHPYEEVAYDIYPLETPSRDYGLGVIGELPRSMAVQPFITHVMKKLNAKTVRTTRTAATRIRRVAVCGGSGSDLTDEAIRKSADAFITADVKYHSFHDAASRILLIDAGHYETEHPVVGVLATRLKEEFRRSGARVRIHTARVSSNPIVYN